jgi:hypothetical protein
MQIAGIAEDLEALEGLVVDGVEWSFADEPGRAHAQALFVTFDDIGEKVITVSTDGGPTRRGRGGCATGVGLLPLGLLLIPMVAGTLKRTGKKRR